MPLRVTLSTSWQSCLTSFQQLQGACLQKEKVTGADVCATAITLCQYLTGKVSVKVHTLLESIVRVAEVWYHTDQKCSPRAILHLYNCTWYHHELLQHLIPHLNVLFGSYLHDVSCHAPPQFELVSLRSCKSKFEEHLFGQARQVAESCTNRTI